MTRESTSLGEFFHFDQLPDFFRPSMGACLQATYTNISVKASSEHFCGTSSKKTT